MTPSPWLDLIEEARRYPSPHNSQPIKVQPIGDREALVFYDLDLGLPAESYGIPFGHVCAGVFLESLATVAAGHGFVVVEDLRHADMDFAAGDRLHPIGTVRLESAPVTAEASRRLEAFRERRTSRRPYDRTLVPPDVIARVGAVAAAGGQRFETTADEATVRDLVHINQATLFSDLQNDAVYGEIMHWLRFSRTEAAATADGLSAETMLMPGGILKLAMAHRDWWSAPVVGRVIRSIYLNTMRGVRQLGWLTGPFESPADYVEAGRAFMRVWLEFTLHGVRLHPFGTVITNPDSHARFAEAVGAVETDGRMAWMLFRFGHSAEPPFAHRRPAAAMLLREESA